MIRPFLIMLFNVCLWAQDEDPTGYFKHYHRGDHVSWWCIQMNWDNYKSQDEVSILVVCDNLPPYTDGTLRLQREKSNHYEVTEKGKADYKDFIDRAISACLRIGLKENQDLFTFDYDPDYDELVTSINSKPVTMVPGDCDIP